jgi:hypothetical protein
MHKKPSKSPYLGLKSMSSSKVKMKLKMTNQSAFSVVKTATTRQSGDYESSHKDRARQIKSVSAVGFNHINKIPPFYPKHERAGTSRNLVTENDLETEVTSEYWTCRHKSNSKF